MWFQAELLLLTSAAEWRVTSVNSDAIAQHDQRQASVLRRASDSRSSSTTPRSTSPHAAACPRGGPFLAGWGYITGDLSLRAPHLSDGLDVVDMAYAKAPYPIVSP